MDRCRAGAFRPARHRFYPALHAAGLLPRVVDARRGYSQEDRDLLLDNGIGITNLVARATARADEISAAELQAGGRILRAVVDDIRPRVVAIAGITAYRLAFGDRRARAGRQPADLGPARLWVVPNPSGLNAHDTVASLAVAYAQAGRDAGLLS